MYILGFDVGGSSVKYAVADDAGNLLEKGKFPTPQDSLQPLLRAMHEVRESYRGRYDFAGAGLSLPGAVDNEAGIIGGASALAYIHNFNIRTEFEKALGLHVAMENDANCAALGEVWKGAAEGYQDMAFFVCGTGIGGAIVKDKHIHHGRHLHGGEFGFMVVDDTYTTLSEAAATVSMAKRVARAKGLPEDAMDGVRAFELMEQGDPDAVREINRMYEYLARAIYNVQYAYDPEITVLGGAISVRPELIGQLEQKLANILKKVEIARVVPKLACCKFGNDANLLGAVCCFLQQEQGCKR